MRFPMSCRRVSLWIACLGVLLAATPAVAQEADSSAELKQVLERLLRVENELAQLKQAKPREIPADPKEQRVVLLMESPYLGSNYYGGPQGKRFLAAKLLLVNLTPKPVVVKRDSLKLVVDGRPQGLAEVPQNLRYHTFQVGREQLQMRTLDPPQEVQVAAGGAATMGVFFADVSEGSYIPKMVVTLDANEATYELDVNAAQRTLLGLQVERIGPRDCLGMLTIAGEINSINVGSLVEELDRLSAAKVSRAVIAWTDAAAPLDSQL